MNVTEGIRNQPKPRIRNNNLTIPVELGFLVNPTNGEHVDSEKKFRIKSRRT